MEEQFFDDNEVFGEIPPSMSNGCGDLNGFREEETSKHLSTISEEHSIQDPNVYSCQGDFRYNSSMVDTVAEVDTTNRAEASMINYARQSDSTLKNRTEASMFNYSRQNDSTLKNSIKAPEQSYFDENLASSSFKCGNDALLLINKDGEDLRKRDALRLPSQTFNKSGQSDFDFDASKVNVVTEVIPKLPVNVFNSKTPDRSSCQEKTAVSSFKVGSDPLSSIIKDCNELSKKDSFKHSSQTCKSQMSARSLPASTDPPTFLLDCTSNKGSQSPPLLDVDKPCVYFGFRPLNYDSTDVLNVNSLVDGAIILRCRLKPAKSEAFKILYKADVKQKIKAFGTYPVYIAFRPKQALRYKATILIDCLSDRNEAAEYTCQLLGFGGQSMVSPLANPTNKARSLVMSAGGRYQLIPSSINKFSFLLENRGVRDAFVSIILQDNNGDEIPTENAFVQPANLLLEKSQLSSKKIEVRMFVQNGSRRNSFGSNSSHLSSAFNNTTGCALPTAFRILIVWGEERQRQRLKMLEKRKREKFFFMNRHFTVSRYDGEQLAWEDATDELLSKEDYRMFEGYLRLTVIEVLDKRYSRYLAESAFKSRPASATGNTVISMEPDNTNNLGHSMLSSIVEG